MPAYQSVAEYIESYPKEVQKILKKIQKMIKDSAPKATEAISYGIIGYKLDNKVLIYLGGFANHISLYPASDEMIKDLPEVEKYRVSKGTLKFKLSEPIPYELVQKVIDYKVREHLENKDAKGY